MGVYHQSTLLKTFETGEQTSEALPTIFKSILDEFQPQKLFFARGPGSFMAIKISYIFLKTMSISLSIPLKACDGFAFNHNGPIRAMRNLYFVKKEQEIVTERFEMAIEQQFDLPHVLDESLFSDDIEPLYLLPAV